MLTKRTNILFDQETWALLQQVAGAEEISIGQAVRKAVRKTYFGKKTRSSLKATLQSIKGNRKFINNPQKAINYQELINYGRKY